MNIDMIAVRDQVIAKGHTALDAFMGISLLEAGGVVLALGLLAGAFEWHRRYCKGKGYRMALKVRDRKKKEILSQVINDGLFEAECKGILSNQEVNGLYNELSVKLNLPDLVPAKRRVKIVKSEIKARLHKGEHKTRPHIPGTPEPNVRPRMREKLGNFASKFWRPAQS